MFSFQILTVETVCEPAAVEAGERSVISAIGSSILPRVTVFQTAIDMLAAAIRRSSKA